MENTENIDGTQYLKCEVHILDTNNESKIHFANNVLWWYPKINCVTFGHSTPKHLFLTINDSMQIGDFVIDPDKKIRKILSLVEGERLVLEGLENLTISMSSCKKILATTDKLCDSLPGIPTAFITKYIGDSNKGEMMIVAYVEMQNDKLVINLEDNTVSPLVMLEQKHYTKNDMIEAYTRGAKDYCISASTIDTFLKEELPKWSIYMNKNF